MIPEARPASAAGTFAIAIVSSGMNASPAPSTDQDERQRDVGEVRGARAGMAEDQQTGARGEEPEQKRDARSEADHEPRGDPERQEGENDV